MAELDLRAERGAPAPRTSVYQGNKLYSYEWKPAAGEIRALLYIGHGIVEYMDRHEKLANHLKAKGILTFGLDYVGHGRSEGIRIDVDSFNSYVQDIVSYMNDMKQQYPSLPLFYMGHSMGGLIAVTATLSHQDMLTGLILSSPALYSNVGSIGKFLARQLARVAPRLRVKSFSSSLNTTVPEEIQAFDKNPLIYHGAIKARIASLLIDQVDAVIPHLGKINCPVLIIHGSEDTLVPIEASHMALNSISSSDKVLEIFEGSRHEVLHDKDQERGRQLISDWITQRLSS